jgi:hypothetical protein
MKKSLFKIARLLFITFLICNTCSIVSGQNRYTNAGTDFWFGFPYNQDGT